MQVRLVPSSGFAIRSRKLSVLRGAGHATARGRCQTSGSHGKRADMDQALRPLSSRRPAGALEGEITVPGDKSISHRALMFAGLAVGESRIEGLLEGEDVLRTAAAMRALGAEGGRDGPGRWRVAGRGGGGRGGAAGPLGMGHSGAAGRVVARGPAPGL